MKELLPVFTFIGIGFMIRIGWEGAGEFGNMLSRLFDKLRSRRR